MPYFSAGSARTDAATTTALFAATTYDPLYRVSAVGTAVGTTTNTYDDWKQTITDPLSHTKSLYRDAFGNLNRVDEVATTTYTTTYEYNYLKNLTKITDSAGNIHNFTYDGLGRRLTAQDLHASGDGTYGTWFYAYDDAGNVTAITDPKSQNYAFDYDDLNRVIWESYTANPGNEVTYSYVSCTNGKGRLCQAEYTSYATTTYAYNPLGIVKTETKVIAGSTFATQFDHDRQGNVTTITYPDNAVMSYTYNSAGLLDAVSKLENGTTTPVAVVQHIDYGPTGAVTSRNFGNGTQTTLTYNAAQLYRLTNILTTATTTVETFGMGGIGDVELPAWASAGPELESGAGETKGDVQVTVGGGKATLNRWGEASLGITIPASDATSSPTLTQADGKIVWDDTQKQARFYELPESAELPEGGYEIDVVYPQKPASNIVTMNIETEGLDFFYQPPLEKDPATDYAARCTPTQCFDEKDNVIMERPENVIGSYAVYYQDGKSGNYSNLGGKNYKTGKAFHIYRPKITDSAGNSVWGDLHIDQAAGMLTVTVAQEFLDKATYPVTVAPTFGYGTVGASSGSTTNAAGSKFTMPENGTVTTITEYTKAASGSINVGAAMYSDNAGAPNSLLTLHTSTPSQGTTASWVDVPVTSYSASTNTPYWLWGWGSASRTIYWDTGSTNRYNVQGMTWPTWDNPITPGTYFSRKISIYATYTAASASSSVQVLQDITYTYDNVGNITAITDHSDTGAAKTIVFGYDDLYRLTSASTTAASSTPFSQTFGYSSIGNIASTSALGTYSYSSTNYANPHAATSINGISLTYDNNGNLTSYGTSTYTWDYRNQLTQAGTGTATSTYTYDFERNRVTQTITGITTKYPNKFFSITGATTTKYIYAGNDLIATVEKTSTGTTTFIVHTDHLSGTNVVTDASGNLAQTLDYYPFGSQRISQSNTSFNEKKQFTGHEYDAEAGLTYMQARYYNGATGRFLSQDPEFWTMVGNPKLLRNPQRSNSYSYAGGNPITNLDPNGNSFISSLEKGLFYTGYAIGDLRYDATNINFTPIFTSWQGYENCFCRDNGYLLKAGEVFGGYNRTLDVISQNAGNIQNASAETGVSEDRIKDIIYEEQSHLLLG